MEYVKLTVENLESEHICCAISNNNDPQVASKKAWLRERLSEGLMFIKSAERGKCFIEYIPSEYAWAPIEAEGCMHINCFWVSGSFKGHGYSNDLLETMIADCREKGKKGITVISSPKKQAFLSDPKYLLYKGFKVVDTAPPFFTLMYLPLMPDENTPKFKTCAKNPKINQEGFVLYYTNGCPYTAKYVPIIESKANELGIPFESRKIESVKDARNAPVAWTNYAMFYNGNYISNEILSENKFITLAKKLGAY